MREYPRGCELDLLTALAVEECDGHDGAVDGIIPNPKSCTFDPFAYIGTNFTCLPERRSMKPSRVAAVIANATWAGPSDSRGNFIWHGPNHGADLSRDLTGTGIASATNTCDDGGACKGVPITTPCVPMDSAICRKGPRVRLHLHHAGGPTYDEIMRRSGAEYDSIVSSSNPNLTEFHRAGGQMMTCHGLYNQVVPIQVTEMYYDDISKFVPDVQDFYRFYEVPGLPHCFGNGQLTTVFDALRAWVENGAVLGSLPTVLFDAYGRRNDRIMCPFPESVVYVKEYRDPTDATCFTCTAGG